MVDPLSIPCPDCAVPAGQPCTSRLLSPGNDPVVHASRVDYARLVAAEHGTCALCGQAMVRLSDPDDVFHPETAMQVPCPVLADPVTDWNTHASQLNAGLAPGRPGPEHFRPAHPVTVTPPRPTHSDPMQPPT